MFKDLTIGAKIASGFCLVLVLLLIVGGLSYYSVSHLLALSNEVEENVTRDTTLADVEVAHLKWVDKVDTLLNDMSVHSLEVQTDDHKCALGTWLYGEERVKAEAAAPQIAPLLREMEGYHARLHASAIAIKDAYRPADQRLPTILALREIDHLDWATKVRDLFIENKAHLDVQTDPSKCAFGVWFQSAEAKRAAQNDPEFGKLLEQCRKPHDHLHRSAIEIQNLWDVNDEAAKAKARLVLEEQTLPALAEVRQHFNECREHVEHAYEGLQQAKGIYADETLACLKSLQGLLAQVRDQVRESAKTASATAQAAGEDTKWLTIGLSVLAILSGSLLALFITRSIIKTLKRIIVGLRDGADQLESASEQVSCAAQQLAEGAGEQASSLEETSSALEEMAAMTRTNAQNADKASNLASGACDAANDGDKTMSRLNTSMNAINESAEKISKIIKVIEEIAFQTNLLALNAAVEAARAGEHGKGFAVVADEVRNLAQRAGQAANETTDLIESSVTNARDGGQVAGEVGESLAKIVADVTQVSDLIAGIARATGEQSQGVDQINSAVSQMDQVTQTNASSAEESAAAAEELSAQAVSVRQITEELMTMVGGEAQRSSNTSNHGRPAPKGATGPKSVVRQPAPVKSNASADPYDSITVDDVDGSGF